MDPSRRVGSTACANGMRDLLQKHFEFDPTNLPANLKKSIKRWEHRLQYLRLADPAKYEEVMANIRDGHSIQFGESKPQKSFRRANPPSLAADQIRAWAAIKKDISHGAIRPVNVQADGIPHCVCPVRTADKNDGTARFVHNSRKVNKCGVPPSASKCKLESLLRTRNMYIPQGFMIGLDFASGYHCIEMQKGSRKFLAFAIDTHELPAHAAEWLHREHPEAFLACRGCFLFEYTALPFGLSSSCKTFNDVVTALAGFWRRCPSGSDPTRVSSYIDDVMAVTKSFDEAMRLTIYLVFEAASLGLSLKIPKCSLFPRHAMKALGTIVDLKSYTFSVTSSRAQKIEAAINDLRCAVSRNRRKVPAKLIASFIGLIWSVSTCCYRAASIMVRSLTHLLTKGLKLEVDIGDLPLVRIMNRFWSGSVEWSEAASQQLNFWSRVNFRSLRAQISADVMGLIVEQTFFYPADFNSEEVSFLFQDASAWAAGGGELVFLNGQLVPGPGLFLAEFSELLSSESSTLRELVGILWCLIATARSTKTKLVFICDNEQSCRAILRGSRVPQIQRVAEAIFMWCMASGKICWPIWIPRTHVLIKEADRRSRLFIPHDERSPPTVISLANSMARRLWGHPLSFDQAASHRTAIWVEGRQLPFNAICFQPGACGVDLFTSRRSWLHQVNYVYPPVPIIGRLLSFLPSTLAKAVVVMRGRIPSAWWTYMVLPGAPGLIESRSSGGYSIFAFDFSVEEPTTNYHSHRTLTTGVRVLGYGLA